MEAWFHISNYIYSKFTLTTLDTFDFLYNLSFWVNLNDQLSSFSYLSTLKFSENLYQKIQTLSLNIVEYSSVFYGSNYTLYFTLPSLSISATLDTTLDSILLSSIFFFSKFFFLFVVALISSLFLFDFFYDSKKLYYISFINFSNFVDSEEEISSLDDLLNFLFLFIFCFVWFFTSVYFFSNFLYNNNTWIFFSLFFTVIIMFSMPFSLFYNLGLFNSFYIKGCGNSNKIFFEIIFDSISLLTVVFRVFIQNIRLIFVFLALLELYTWVYTSSQLNSFLFFLNKGLVFNTYILSSSSYLDLFFNLVNVLILYFYYFLHLIFLIFTQISVYFLLIFWVFFFLYTCFFFFKFETYFLIKKNLNKRC